MRPHHESERRALEEKLRTELEAAQVAWERAGVQLHRTVDIARSIGLNKSDGTFALHRASTAYRVSLQNYRQCLKRFREFVLLEKPEDE